MNAACPIIAEEELLQLNAGEMHTIAAPGEMVIRCTRGATWVTQSGVHEDVVLEAGMSFRPRAAGKVVIQALSGRVGISLEHAAGRVDHGSG
jgi:hypothetical protein